MVLPISVIIPAYQAEKYIAQAVESVRSQNYAGAMEIIVIDDGSADNTAAAAEALGVTVLRKAQGGAASARNEGLRTASGSLVLLLDADDVLTEGALQAMLQAMEENNEDAVSAMAEDFVSPELTEAEKAELKPRTAPYGGVLPGCSLIRRSVFDTVGLFDDTMKSGETVAWLLKLRDMGIKTNQISVVTLKRRLHLTNTGRTQQKQEMANYAALLRKRMMKKT
jgi:glycosyltransferase involved in cell wall biosynthesis